VYRGRDGAPGGACPKSGHLGEQLIFACRGCAKKGQNSSKKCVFCPGIACLCSLAIPVGVDGRRRCDCLVGSHFNTHGPQRNRKPKGHYSFRRHGVPRLAASAARLLSTCELIFHHARSYLKDMYVKTRGARERARVLVPRVLSASTLVEG
jgi:hypothetical protein